MLSVFEFAAESRVEVGTGKSRRFRRAGRVPAVLYGGGKSPLLLSLNHNEVIKRLLPGVASDWKAWFPAICLMLMLSTENEAPAVAVPQAILIAVPVPE